LVAAATTLAAGGFARRALEALVRETRPVASRRPARALGVVVLASLLIVAVHVHSHRVRGDYAALPKALFWVTTGTLAAAFALSLAMTLVPRAGSVLPDTRRARFCAGGVCLLALSLALFLRVDAPPATVIPTGAAAVVAIEACLVNGLEVSAIPFVLAPVVIATSGGFQAQRSIEPCRQGQYHRDWEVVLISEE
jgi:hypothetical protein